jgi:hypothetical protein
MSDGHALERSRPVHKVHVGLVNSEVQQSLLPETLTPQAHLPNHTRQQRPQNHASHEGGRRTLHMVRYPRAPCQEDVCRIHVVVRASSKRPTMIDIDPQ